MGDVVTEFLAVTGTDDRKEAEKWLELADFDVETAVNLMFCSLTDVTPALKTSGNNRGTGKGSSKPKKFVEEDYDEDGVRKPLPAQRMRLVASPGGEVQRFYNENVSTFASDDKLYMLYKPPLEIMTQGSFEQVKEIARRDKKWLLVNIQDETNFDCLVYNRDIWSDVSLQEVIQCSFVFWQQLRSSPSARDFDALYPIYGYPFVAILDPRTGAMMWRCDKKVDLLTMGEKFQDFLGKRLYPGSDEKKNDATANLGGNALKRGNAADQARTIGGVTYIDAAESPGPKRPAAAPRNQKDGTESIGRKKRGGSQEVISLEEWDEESSSEEAETMQSPRKKIKGSDDSSNKGSNTSPEDRPNDRKIPGFSVEKLLRGAEDHEETATEESNSTSPGVRILIKLPHGEKHLQIFQPTSSLVDIARFAARKLANSRQGESAASDRDRFELRIPYPQRALSEICPTAALNSPEVNIFGNSVVLVEYIDSSSV